MPRIAGASAPGTRVSQVDAAHEQFSDRLLAHCVPGDPRKPAAGYPFRFRGHLPLPRGGNFPYRLRVPWLKDTLMTQDLIPGTLVRHPSEPEWGLGQVQSAIGPRITVNFEHRGKVLINGDRVALTVVVGHER